MLDFLEQIPAEWRPFALVLFVVIGALGGWLSYFRGKKAGPEAPKVQEFYASGGLYDMGPVRELIEQTGLLFQQQVKTNILQGETNQRLSELANTLKAYVEDRRKADAERDMAEEIDRESDRKARILAESMVREREEEAADRRPPRKPT